jgi:hypothetical protein
VAIPAFQTSENMKWYYLNNRGEVTGPVSADTLGQLSAVGALAADTQVCGDGSEEWISFEQAFASAAMDITVPTDVEPFKQEPRPAENQREPESRIVTYSAAVALILVAGALIGFFLVQKGRGGDEGEEGAEGSGDTPKTVDNRNDPDHLFKLGMRYFKGEKFVGEAALKKDIEMQDYELAFEQFLAAANHGHAEAQFYLSVCYIGGLGVSTDLEKAMVWLQKSADQEFGKAQFTLGIAHINREGVNKNEQAGLAWIKKAADIGDADAQWFLGSRFISGKGVEMNKEHGVEFLRKAAEQKHAQALLFCRFIEWFTGGLQLFHFRHNLCRIYKRNAPRAEQFLSSDSCLRETGPYDCCSLTMLLVLLPHLTCMSSGLFFCFVEMTLPFSRNS